MYPYQRHLLSSRRSIEMKRKILMKVNQNIWQEIYGHLSIFE